MSLAGENLANIGSNTSSSTTTVESKKEGVTEISAPVVFQCLKCNLVVGDSLSYNCANEEIQTITLSAASNIKRTEEVFTSKVEFDFGSTYVTFRCSGCENPLGKYYLTTSRDMDNMREAFTFYIKNIACYELGKSMHGKVPPETSTVPMNALLEKRHEEIILLETIESLRKSISNIREEFRDEIKKIQFVIFGVDTRVEHLEQKRKVDQSDEIYANNKADEEDIGRFSKISKR